MKNTPVVILVSLIICGALAVVSTEQVLASVDTPTFTVDLHLGSSGSEVSALQSYLEGQGFLVMPAGVAKGYFGTLTKAALARYQEREGITPAIGYFGPKTRAQLMANVTVPQTPLAINDANIQGVWVISLADPKDPQCLHTPADTYCEPNDSMEMEISIENGVRTYNSWLHNRPELGTCGWSVKGRDIAVTCPVQKTDFTLHVQMLTKDTLTIKVGDDVLETWKRFVEKKEEVKDVPAAPLVKSWESFVPDGWQVLASTTADFDGDDLMDAAFVSERSTRSLVGSGAVSAKAYPRRLTILHGIDTAAGYAPWAQSDTLVLRSSEGGVVGDPFAEKTLTFNAHTQLLTLSFSGGSRDRWTKTFMLQLDRGKWYLVEYDMETYDSLSDVKNTSCTYYLFEIGIKRVSECGSGIDDSKDTLTTFAAQKIPLATFNFTEFDPEILVKKR